MAISEKLKTLLGSEAFVEEAASVENTDELQALLARHGIEMSITEIMELGEKMTRLMDSDENGELSEDDLEDVTGGGLWNWIKSWFNKLAKKNTDDINDILAGL